MKSIQILFLLIFFVFELPAQIQYCEPAPDGIPATDEPPGCRMCDIHYFGTTANYTPDTTNYDFPCSSQEHTQWISVLNTNEGLFELEIFSSNCESGQGGIEFAVFDADLNRISDCIAVPKDDFAYFTLDDAKAGSIFHIMIDGTNDDICEFEVFNHSGIDIFFDFIRTPADDYICPGKQVCYSMPDWLDGQVYDWGRPPNSFVIDGGEPGQDFICIEYTDIGIGTVEVYGENECFIPVHGFLDVNVQLKISEIDTTLCPGDYLEIHNIRYDSTVAKKVFIPIPGFDGCDSIVDLDLKISDLSPPEIFCSTDTFLNAMSFRWTKPIGAEEYQVYIDDVFLKTQGHSSHLLLPNFSNDSVTISVQPMNEAGCNFEKSESTCAIPKLSSRRAILDDSRVKVLANPTSDLVQVKSDLKIESIQVFDFSGKEILFSKEKMIDLSSFSAGVYILKIKSENNTFIRKVIKL